MIKEMTTLESRERKGGEGNKRSLLLLVVVKEPGLLATSRASFLEKLRVWLCLAPASFTSGHPFRCIRLITASVKQP
jgi:hypothetical protein